MNLRRSSMVVVVRCMAAAFAVCWLSASCAVVAACPSECSCKWKSGKITAECSDRGLITVPRINDTDTQVLDMSGNDLQTLHRDLFLRDPLISLQKIFLRSCRLGQIDKYAFRGLSNLVEMDLSNNLLTHVPSHAFEDVPYLRNLSLSRNPIQKVEAFAFQSVPQLQRLDLAGCRIQSIRPNAFENLHLLEHLKLNDNQLQLLPTDTLESLPKLRTVELHTNSWICDCHLRGLKVCLFERALNVPNPRVLCAGGPERLRNHSIMDLDAEDFACRPIIKTEMRHVEATVGANVTLECRVESDPVATVNWYLGAKQLIANDTVHDEEGGHRLYIVESGDNVYDKRSQLVLAGVEQTDAGEYHCVAENRAGHDEANFTVNAVSAASTLAVLGGSNINVITVALGFLILFMLLVIVLLLKRIRYTSYGGDDDDDVNVKKQQQHQQQHQHQHPEKSNSIDTSSQKSHDSEYKSESGKAFTVTSDLSYSRSLSDIGNPCAFSNPDLINGAPNVRDSACATPITRPISDYCHNWQKSYAMPPGSRAMSASGFAYELPHDRVPMVVDTMSAGSGSDDVFTHSRMSNDYPPDYGLPILPEHEIASQPCAKTLKVWQRGVPVFPPMCSAPAMAAAGLAPPPNFQTLAHHQPPLPPPHIRQSPADDRRYQRCGTDV